MTVRWEVCGDQKTLIVSLTGQLCLRDTTRVRDRLFKCLAEQPGALLVDLTGLRVAQPLSLAIFTVVLRQAARWPGTPVLLCGPSPETREHLLLGAYRRLPLFDSVPTALDRLRDERLTVPTLTEELLPVSGSARHARNVVTEACLRWDLPDLVAPASLVATELVANAVDHAHTMMKLRLSLRPRYLNIAVRDGCAEQPVLRAPPLPQSLSRGRGLLLVDATAYTWGCLPSEDGKVVWAALRR